MNQRNGANAVCSLDSNRWNARRVDVGWRLSTTTNGARSAAKGGKMSTQLWRADLWVCPTANRWVEYFEYFLAHRIHDQAINKRVTCSHSMTMTSPA